MKSKIIFMFLFLAGKIFPMQHGILISPTITTKAFERFKILEKFFLNMEPKLFDHVSRCEGNILFKFMENYVRLNGHLPQTQLSLQFAILDKYFCWVYCYLKVHPSQIEVLSKHIVTPEYLIQYKNLKLVPIISYPFYRIVVDNS